MKMRPLVCTMLFAALMAGPALGADTTAAIGREPARVPTVTVATAAMTEVSARIFVSGTLVAREEVLVSPRIDGYAIEQINVDVGDRVASGDVLAVLDDSVLAGQLTQAEAELLRAQAAVRQAESQIDSAGAARDEAEATLERAETLRSSGTTSQAALNQAKAAAAAARAADQSARAGLEVARAQVQQATSQRDLAQTALARTKIKAPVGGLIAARNAKLGAIAASGGEPLFRIIRDGEIEIEAEVIETALGQVQPGDPGAFDLAGNGTAVGAVRLVSPAVDPVTRLGTIRIALDSVADLRSGTFASGWIVTARYSAVTVPARAVLADPTGNHVQVVAGGKVERRPVVAGLLSEDGRREIVEGLAAGETVIARAGAFFRDGDQVAPIPASAAGATQATTSEAAAK